MSAVNIPLTIEQGATYRKKLTWKDSAGDPIDISGYTARMHIREEKDSSNTLIELTDANGGIALGGAAGTIEMLILADVTETITWADGVYDLELVLGVEVIRFTEGAVTVSFEVTR